MFTDKQRSTFLQRLGVNDSASPASVDDLIAEIYSQPATPINAVPDPETRTPEQWEQYQAGVAFDEHQYKQQNGVLSRMGDAAQRGWNNWQAAGDLDTAVWAANANDNNQGATEEDPFASALPQDYIDQQRAAGEQGFIDNSAEAAAIPASPLVQALGQQDSISDALSIAGIDPLSAAATLTAESGMSLVESGGGALVGGLLGGVPGAMAGSGLMSANSARRSQMASELREKYGVNLADRDALSTALDDKEMREAAQGDAARYGMAVGATEALGMGVAGRIVAPAGAGVLRRLGEGAAQTGVGMGAGAGGDALGSLVSGNEISGGSMVAEALGEVGGAPAEVYSAYQANTRDAAQKKEKEMLEKLKNGEPVTSPQDAPPGPTVTPPSAGAPQNPENNPLEAIISGQNQPQQPAQTNAEPESEWVDRPDGARVNLMTGETDDTNKQPPATPEQRAELVQGFVDNYGLKAEDFANLPADYTAGQLIAQAESAYAEYGNQGSMLFQPEQTTAGEVSTAPEANESLDSAHPDHSVAAQPQLEAAKPAAPKEAARPAWDPHKGVFAAPEGGAYAKPVKDRAKARSAQWTVFDAEGNAQGEYSKAEMLEMLSPSTMAETDAPAETTLVDQPDLDAIGDDVKRESEGTQKFRDDEARLRYLKQQRSKRQEAGPEKSVTIGNENINAAAEQAVPGNTPNPTNIDGTTLEGETVPLDEAANEAATSPTNDLAQPTQAQKEAGNYAVGKVNLNGLNISIENPAGSERSGVDGGGKPWSVTMQHHYGYIRGTKGADGDHVDTFIKPGTADNPNLPVVVVDQVDPSTGKFDEHKVVMGAADEAEAREIYNSNYDKDWKGLGSLRVLSQEQFKDWIDNGNTTKPIAKQRLKKVSAPDPVANTADNAQISPPKQAPTLVSPEFVPTHEDSMGNPLRETDEPGVYVDAKGVEVEDDGAARIESTDVRETDNQNASAVKVSITTDNPESESVKPSGEDTKIKSERSAVDTKEEPASAAVDQEPENVSDNTSSESTAREPANTPVDSEGETNTAEPKSSGRLEDEASAPKDPPAIDDFGEVLQGARKHLSELRGKLTDEITDTSAPLSSLFPKPNYTKLAQDGLDPKRVAAVALIRNSLPRKPAGRRWARSGNSWVNDVNQARSAAAIALDPDADMTVVDAYLESAAEYSDELLALANDLPADKLGELGNWALSRWTSIKDGESDGERYFAVPLSAGKVNRAKRLAEGRTVQEAIKFLKSAIVDVNNTSDQKTAGRKKIASKVYRDGSQFKIAKKSPGGRLVTLKAGFETAKDAFSWQNTHADDLVAVYKEKTAESDVRTKHNRDREGDDRRETDVTPEAFGETFGFRGVQFGNWVAGKERQQSLNRAFDALIDLADAVGVEPKALSLNGELGLAFGARGSGGKNAAAAHYESGTVVINLTRKNGAGSLAHEWLHGLDDYFGRAAGTGFVTEASQAKRNSADGKDGIRPEMFDAWQEVMSVITTKTKMPQRSNKRDQDRKKPYWGTRLEMAARSFENYIIDKLNAQGVSNDYLANVGEVADQNNIPDDFAYLSESEQEVVGKAFDQLFDTMGSRTDDDGNVALFSRGDTHTGATSGEVRNWIGKRQKGIHQMLKDGQLQIVEKTADLPGEYPDDVQGVVIDGTVYLVANNLSKDTVDGVLLHEIGVHRGLKDMVGGRAFRGILNDVRALRAKGNKQAQAAYDRVPDDTPDNQVDEEALAYLVEESPRLPLVRRVKATIRAALRKMGLIREYTPDDMVRAAQGALRRTSLGESTASAGQSEGPQFSRLATAKDTVVEAVQDFEAIRKRVTSGKYTAGDMINKTVLATLTRRQWVEVAKGVVPRLQKYLKDAYQMEADQTEEKAKADKIANRWAKWSRENKAEAEQLVSVMHAATIAGVDPDKEYVELTTADDTAATVKKVNARVKLYATDRRKSGNDIKNLYAERIDAQNLLKQEENRAAAKDAIYQAWEALSPDAQRNYRRVREYHKRQHKSMVDALIKRIDESVMDARERSGAIAKIREQFESQEVTGPYFPLARFGEHVVTTYLDEARTDRRVDFFETEGAAREWENSQREQFADVERKTLSSVEMQAAAGLDESSIQDVHKIIDGWVDPGSARDGIHDALQQLYLQALPSMSARKHFIHRANVKGFSEDAIRAFADTSTHNSNYLGKLKYGHQMQRGLEEAERDYEAATDSSALKRTLKEKSEFETWRDDYLHDGTELREDAADYWKQITGRLDNKLTATQHKDRTAEQHAEVREHRRMLELFKRFGEGEQGVAAVERSLDSIEQRLDTVSKIKSDPGNISWARGLLDEAKRSHQEVMNPNTPAWVQAFSQVGFFMYLGLSPIAAAVNMTQVPMVSLPVLGARYGNTAAAKELAIASKQVGGNWLDFRKTKKGGLGKGRKGYEFGSVSMAGSLKGEDKKAFRELQRRGVFEKSQAHDLMGMSESGDSHTGLKSGMMKVSGYMFHQAEAMNRQITGMAAYRLARKSGKSHEKSIDEAMNQTYDTQGDYASSNRARMMRAPSVRVLTQFKQYAQFMTYLNVQAWKRTFGKADPETKAEALKQLIGLNVMQALFAGTTGMFGASSIGWTVEQLANAFDDEDDEPLDWRREYRGFLADKLPTHMAHAVADGVVDAYTPMKLSSRVSIGELWWRSSQREIETPNDWNANLFKNLAGPTIGGIPEKMFRAYKYGDEGDWLRAIETALPTGMGNPLKAERMAREGVKTRAGNEVMLPEEYGTFEALLQAAGMGSSNISERWEELGAKKGTERFMNDRKAELVRGAAEAIIDGNNDERDEYVERIKKFNQANPAFAVKSPATSIRKRVKAIHIERATFRANDGMKATRQGAMLNERYDFGNY